ncbi:MAG: D-alanyl-D-alanine carboxypeptidase family protein [Microgenomates group bacterium]
MWKLKSPLLFLLRFKKLDLSRQLLSASCLLLAFLYPGHNPLQTIIINPGKVYSYSIPAISPSLYPVSDGVKAPSISAKSVVVQDVTGKSILYSKNPDMLMMPASITKVMTALVALDYWKDLGTVIEVKNEDRAIGQTIELVKGERITIQNILYGLLVHSGNDAALALAENYSGGYDAFVSAMNQKAKALHLDHTTFKNPSGVEQYGHLTTARDIAILAAYALKNPEIVRIVQMKRIIVTDVTGLIAHDLETTNELLGEIPGLKGLKTGWTSGAGECLVSYIERDGKQIVIVVLGSLSRFGDTRVLIDWVYAHHSWITPNI